MNNVDIDFIKQVKTICDKNEISFDELDFTISKLMEWIFAFYKFQKRETAKRKAIFLNDMGMLVSTNKGFRFSEKARDLIK